MNLIGVRIGGSPQMLTLIQLYYSLAHQRSLNMFHFPIISLLLFTAPCKANGFLMVSFLILLRSLCVYTALLRKVVGKNVLATIPKGDMGYDQYTVPDTQQLRNLLLVLSFGTRKHTSMVVRANELLTQNHTKYLQGMSRALFPTAFLEVAVY